MKKPFLLLVSFIFCLNAVCQNDIIQKGHSGSINTLKVSPDELSLATGGYSDGQVILWDINLRQVKYSYQTYGYAIEDIAFNPLKKELAAIDSQGNIFVWNTETNSLEHQYLRGVFGPEVYEENSNNFNFHYEGSTGRDGGVLSFINNELFIGYEYINVLWEEKSYQSSLWKINFDSESITPLTNIPKDKDNRPLGISYIKPINNEKIVIQIDQYLNDKSSIILYDIKNDKVDNYILKKKADIESVAINKDNSKIAISREENYEPNTYIFDILSGEKINKILSGGEISWQNEGLWIGGGYEMKYYDADENVFKDYFTLGRFSNLKQIQYLSKHKKLLLNSTRKISLIAPLEISQTYSTEFWTKKGKDNYMFTPLFLDNENVFIQYQSWDVSSVDNEKYIWNLETKSIKEFFPHKKQSRVQGIKKDIIYGYDLDSTKTLVKSYYDTIYQDDYNTFDFYKYQNGEFERKESLDFTNILQINKNHESMFVFDETNNIHLINYKTQDTIKTLYKQFKDRNSIKEVFYDPSSGNIAVFKNNSDYNKAKDAIEFFNISDNTNTPFYVFELKTIYIYGYDGKKRLITNSDNYKQRIINIANPRKFTILENFFSDIVCFHPLEPWIFYAKNNWDDNNDNSIGVYDYNKNTEIGGVLLNENGYEFEIDKIAISPDGQTCVASLVNNGLVALSVSKFTDSKTITAYNKPVSKISDNGKFISLNSNIINLSNIQVEKKFRPNSYTKIIDGKAFNFFVTENQGVLFGKKKYYFIQEEYSLETKYSKIDSVNISDIGISEDHRPIYLDSNKYLFFENTRTFKPGITILDLETLKIIFEDPELDYSEDFSSDNTSVSFSSWSSHYKWERDAKKFQEKIIRSQNLYINTPQYSIVSPSNGKILKSELNGLIQYDLENTIPNDTIIIPEAYSQISLLSKVNDSLTWGTVFSKEKKVFGLTSFNLQNEKWNEFIPVKSRVNKLFTTDSKEYLITILSTGEIQFRNSSSGALIATILSDPDGDIIALSTDGFFASSNPNKSVYKKNIKGEIFYDKILDIQKNRPDKIMQLFGKSDDSQIERYQKAVELRKEFINFKESEILKNKTLELDYAKQPLIVNNDLVTIEVKDTAKIDTLSTVINGISFKNDAKDNTNASRIPLIFGENHVQLFNNDSSLGKEIKITSALKNENANLILCTINVSKYKDSNFNLKYAVKDGKDLLEAFKSQNQEYDSIQSYNLFDEDVTKENIESLFNKISDNPNDKLIVFFSGHGLLDEDNNFYFGTHDVDFDNPQIRGMDLVKFQRLLSNLKSQKKLLFIDACYSGIADTSKDSKVTESDETVVAANDSSVGTKGGELIVSNTGSNSLSLTAFELMQNVFPSFSLSSGLEIITAASGSSVALESSKWQNGAFTYAIKSGLIDFEADMNRNGIISVNELKNYIFKTVPILTKGMQKPTNRAANNFLDWNLWY